MSMKNALLLAPPYQLNPSVRPLIEKWSDCPTALQILEVVDKCIYASLANKFTLNVMQKMLDVAMSTENITMTDLEPQAVWRKGMI